MTSTWPMDLWTLYLRVILSWWSRRDASALWSGTVHIEAWLIIRANVTQPWAVDNAVVGPRLGLRLGHKVLYMQQSRSIAPVPRTLRLMKCIEKSDVLTSLHVPVPGSVGICCFAGWRRVITKRYCYFTNVSAILYLNTFAKVVLHYVQHFLLYLWEWVYEDNDEMTITV